MENLKKSEKILNETRTEYRFKKLSCTVREVNIQGSRLIISLDEWAVIKPAPTLQELLTNFLSQEVHCHEQNMNEFVRDKENPNRLKFVVYGLPTDDCVFFLQPREQDLIDFRNGKESMWIFNFDIEIEKCVLNITRDLSMEFDQIGIKNYEVH